MCGICGIIHFDERPAEESSLRAMMKKMQHRGPDDEGLMIDGNLGLGHVRLSIIDLSEAGKQPFECDDKRFYISFNGEIYNYIELKKQLSGFNFRTKTDTEVLLNAYKKWGPDCLNQLNGMFAVAIYDKDKKELFIARDRFGVKPLYYYLTDKIFLFASEIKPLLAMQKTLQPDENIIYDYLAFDRVSHTENTFFKGIKKLQHGHTLLISTRRPEPIIKRWYSLNNSLKNPFTNADEYRDALARSVKLRLRSDVPVGALLSGGLDSSAIVSLWLKEFDSSNLHTFSAIYGKGEHGDETDFIDLYKSSVKKMWFCQPTAKSLFEDIPSLINCLEEPFPSTSIYAQFKIQELVCKHVTVVLSGQGADEALGGYPYFFGYYYKELLKAMRLSRMFSEMYSFLNVHHSGEALKSFVFFMLPQKLQKQVYHRSKEYISFNPSGNTNSQNWLDLYSSETIKNAFLSHFEHKFEHLLLWGDKVSMNFSTEMRFPFLDYNLLERTIGMKNEKILFNGTTKVILREALKNILPETIRTRTSKIGFETPQSKWFGEPFFKEMIFDLLHSSAFNQRGYVNPKKALKMYECHLAGKKDFSSEIWKWINLELWFRNFFDSGNYKPLITSD